MIAAILRIILLLLPLVALLMWLRWRMKTDRSEDELQQDLTKLRRGLIVVVIMALATGIGLKLTDPNKGDARTKYIPPHTVDGEVVPGRFVPADEAPEEGEDTEPNQEAPRDQTEG
ncbi:MAG: hypothetical protein HWE08_08845 [Alphaproteobacteria bacterium]|nr:hypothetical protein [Alphaproteobacteria bacterium]